jgi:hypothetical protein
VKDPYTGASLYFTPHCFRHSFATALAPLIGGDAKTGAKILGHFPQTFMRYVRANDDTARGAIEKMVCCLPLATGTGSNGEMSTAAGQLHSDDRQVRWELGRALMDAESNRPSRASDPRRAGRVIR